MPFPVAVEGTWVNPSSVQLDASELRRADSAMFSGAGGVVFGGIVRHGDTSLTVAVDASLNVTVQPGAVAIPGPSVGSGVYRSALSAQATGTLAARDATNPRIDLVIYRQLDIDAIGSHTGYTGQIAVLTGTPSATPAAPALPSMAVELARVTVPQSGGAAPSVDGSFRTYACATGAELPVATAARLPASAPKWQRARALDTGAVHIYNGTSWSLDNGGLKFASGTVVLSDGGAEPRSKTVNFPVGLFTTAPAVTLTPKQAANATTGHNFWTAKETTTSFIADMTKTTTTVTAYTWTALGT